MSGLPLRKHSLVSFNNLRNNILLEMPKVDWLSQQGKMKKNLIIIKKKADIGKERK